MNDITLPGLIVPVEARIDRLEKAMQRAAQVQARHATQMERRAKQSADRMTSTYQRVGQAMTAAFARLGPAAGAALGGMLGAGAITGLVAQAVQASRAFADMGDAARRAGVPVKDFQEWAFVAKANRIEVDSLTDGLKEMNLRADEFIQTGKGSGAEAFARLGYTATDLAQKIKNPSDLLLEIIDRLGQFDRAAQIRIADEVFGGTGGERFVELISQGEAGLRRTIDRAQELGGVVDDELIAKATRVNERFNEITTTVGVTLKSAIVSAADSLAEFIDGFREFDRQRSETLQSRQTAIMRERADLIAEQRGLEDGSALSETARGLGFTPDHSTNREGIARIQERIDALTAEEDQIIGILQDRTPAFTPQDRQWTPPVLPNTPTDPNADAGKGKSDKQDDYARTVASIEAETQARARETESLTSTAGAGRTYAEAMKFAATKAQLLAAAQRDGMTITPQLEAQIDQLAAGYVSAGNRAATAADKLKEVEQASQRGAQAIGSIFAGMLTGATSAEQALSGLLARMAEVQLQKLAMQAFGGAEAGSATAFIGGLLGFASGGYTGQGGKFEPAGIVHRGEFVMSKAATERLGVGNLDRLHRSALQGYSGGGLVGDTRKALAPAGGRSGGVSDRAISISAPITVNGGGGTPDQNHDLARQIAREHEAAMRGLIQKELGRHMRQGGMLNR